jgi:hypothetical protein
MIVGVDEASGGLYASQANAALIAAAPQMYARIEELKVENARLRAVLEHADAIINYGNHDIDEWAELTREIRAAIAAAGLPGWHPARRKNGGVQSNSDARMRSSIRPPIQRGSIRHRASPDIRMHCQPAGAPESQDRPRRATKSRGTGERTMSKSATAESKAPAFTLTRAQALAAGITEKQIKTCSDDYEEAFAHYLETPTLDPDNGDLLLENQDGQLARITQDGRIYPEGPEEAKPGAAETPEGPEEVPSAQPGAEAPPDETGCGGCFAPGGGEAMSHVPNDEDDCAEGGVCVACQLKEAQEEIKRLHTIVETLPKFADIDNPILFNSLVWLNPADDEWASDDDSSEWDDDPELFVVEGFRRATLHLFHVDECEDHRWNGKVYSSREAALAAAGGKKP